jgi:DNA-binding response OmpR family regulator
MRILIAEDEPDIRLLLEEILTLWGYEVIAAQDGNEAYQILQSENPPKICILDRKMPGFQGLELCRKVRNIEEDCYTIIILTAQNSDEDIICGLDAGADDYIFKPFNINELRGRINAGRRIIELNQELLETRKALQVKANQDLRESQKQLRDIIEFLPDATLAVDKDKRIIFWNRAIEEITGIPADEMIGKGDYAYTIPFYGETRQQLMDLIFEDKEEISARY